MMFLLKAGDETEDMKTFVKAFINSADIGMFKRECTRHIDSPLRSFIPSLMLTGPTGAHVSVVQYGDTNKVEINWRDEQSKSQLLSLVESVRSRSSTGTGPALGTVRRKPTHACTIEDRDTCRLTALHADRFGSEVRCANRHLAGQRRQSRSAQSCGDAGRRQICRRRQRGSKRGHGGR